MELERERLAEESFGQSQPVSYHDGSHEANQQCSNIVALLITKLCYRDVR